MFNQHQFDFMFNNRNIEICLDNFDIIWLNASDLANIFNIKDLYYITRALDPDEIVTLEIKNINNTLRNLDPAHCAGSLNGENDDVIITETPITNVVNVTPKHKVENHWAKRISLLNDI